MMPPEPSDTLAGSTRTTIWDTSAFQPKQGPTRCPNCNRTYRGTCRKCMPQHNIKKR